MTEIQLVQKNVCNTIRYYPVCQNAKLFSNLIGRKTLHKSELAIIKKLGVNVVIKKKS